MDAIVIAVVVVLNAVLGWVQEAKAHNAVAALARMTQATSGVWFSELRKWIFRAFAQGRHAVKST